MERPAHPLIAIAGPTGSGKSELALDVCERFGGEVVNCDSVQVYRHFHVGTAKVPPDQRRGIPHHLMDIVEPDEVFTAGEYARRARAALAEIATRGRLPVVTGGTGFYLRALLDGLSEGPGRNEALRARLLAREARRPGSLHRLLRRLDPPAGERIHANDRNKTLRALELRVLRDESGATLPAPDPLRGFRVLKIGLNPPRASLYEQLDRRLVAMFDGGLPAEVRSLLARGIGPTAKPFESLGYKEALAAERGSICKNEAIGQAQQATRHYAKRQLTWFRRDAEIRWLDGFGAEEPVRRKAASLIVEHLK